MYGHGYGARLSKGKATYGEIGGPSGYLATLTPFAGNSMSARWEDGTYVVYSYSTPIARYSTHNGVELNLAKYSVTTSRHQGLTAAWLASSPGVS